MRAAMKQIWAHEVSVRTGLEKSFDGIRMSSSCGKPQRAFATAFSRCYKLRHIVLFRAGDKQVDCGSVAAVRCNVQGRGSVGVGLRESGKAARAQGASRENMRKV